MMNSEVRASGHCFAQRPITVADTYCCRATDRTRPVVLASLWNLSGHDQTLLLDASGRPAVAFGHAESVAPDDEQ